MKRTSNTELNHENWDQKEKPEERGQFEVADKEVISARKFKVAKRAPTSNIGSIFKSFGEVPNSAPATLTKDDNYEKHLNNLKQLNKRFLENIEKCISENSCCILSPILDDYQMHLTTIRTKYPLSKNETTNLSGSSVDVPKVELPIVNKPAFGFNFNATPAAPIINNEIKETPKPMFLFGNSTAPAVSSSPFSIFGDNKPKEAETSSQSLFGNGLFQAATTSVANVTTNDDEEEYVPPKIESRDIKEPDSVYDVRCKLFYQADLSWKEKGVGNLFIKPSTAGQAQLVMRADNTLGTILLNALITKVMPVTVNKNNVNVVLMTDFTGGENKPTPLLIRVKTEDAAGNLVKAIKAQLE